jgi:hypothetical protein
MQTPARRTPRQNSPTRKNHSSRIVSAMARTRPPRPLARFRVYVWNSSLYFLVIVWPTKREMLDERVRLCLPRASCDAHVFSYDAWTCRKGKPDRKRPIVGEIHFHKQALGSEAISHECFHATLSALCRQKCDFSRLNDQRTNSRTMALKDDLEETAATMCGRLVRDVVNGLYDRLLL